MSNWQKRPKLWRMRLNFTTFRLHPSNGIWRRPFHRPGFKQKKSNSPKPPKKSSRIGRLWIFKNRIIRGKLQTTQNTKSHPKTQNYLSSFPGFATAHSRCLHKFSHREGKPPSNLGQAKTKGIFIDNHIVIVYYLINTRVI